MILVACKELFKTRELRAIHTECSLKVKECHFIIKINKQKHLLPSHTFVYSRKRTIYSGK